LANSPQTEMKIVSWNIRQGGGSRIDRIQNAIRSHQPDVLILPEFRNNPAGATLRKWLAEFGHTYQASGITLQAKDNTVLLTSKFPFSESTFPELEENRHRCVSGRFGRLTILAWYFATMERKRPLFQFLKGLSKDYVRRETLIMGDLNTGCRYWDEGRMDLSLVEEFGALVGCGWTDVWRQANPGVREWTWVEPWGRHVGYRLDHALVSPPLLSRVQNIYYSHAERETKISDHSAVVLMLK
jgi:exodeoxyribonuclease-3